MAEINSDAATARQGELRGVLPAGSRLRSYELISVLGRGAFGITYQALDTRLHRDVAIKEYLPTSLALRDGGTMVMPLSTELAEEFVWGRERFLDEARTLVKLDGVPAVVRVIDFLEDNGTAYMVMALARGETLDQRLLRDGALPPPAIERMLYPLLDGLQRVHEVGFLHRDIKPANIILDGQGNPTLIDFGAARSAMAGRSTAMTAIFTPGYAAAEQMTSARQGPWTDIYGLSATLYHAMTGRVPPSAFDRILDDSCEPLGKMALPGFPRGLLAGVDAGLAVRASDRPQSIAGWRPILGQTASLDGNVTMAMSRSSLAPQPTVTPPLVATPLKRRSIGLLVGTAVAAVLVLAGGYYALVEDKRGAPQTAALSTPWPIEKAAQDAELQAAAQRLKDQEELAKLRAESEQRQKAEQEAAQRRHIEEETRRKIEAEMAEKKRLEDEARQKAEAEAKLRVAQQPPAIPPPTATAAPATTAQQPVATAPQPGPLHDGPWTGALDCNARRTQVQGMVSGGVGNLTGGVVSIRIQIVGESASIVVRPRNDGIGGRPVGSSQMGGKIAHRAVYAQGIVGGEPCTVSLVGP